MEPLKGVPLTGQGTPLPLDFGYSGEWLHENRIFLYRPGAQQTLGGREMTPFVRNADGSLCFGINSMQLAFTLRVSSTDIFLHNRSGTLYLVRTDEIPPTGGALGAKRYIFQIGDVQAPIVLEMGGPSGNA